MHCYIPSLVPHKRRLNLIMNVLRRVRWYEPILITTRLLVLQTAFQGDKPVYVMPPFYFNFKPLKSHLLSVMSDESIVNTRR